MNEILDIHKPFLSWLHNNNLLFVYHRPDKRSGIATGWPDFTICHCGKCLFIEAKTPKGRVTPIQHMMHLDLRANGNTVKIARSAPEAISAVQTWLGVEKAATEAQARQDYPLDNERAAELIAEASVGIGDILSGRTSRKPPLDCADPLCPQHSKILWIGNLFGVDYVFRGDSSPGSTAEKLRRATPQDIRDLPRK